MLRTAGRFASGEVLGSCHETATSMTRPHQLDPDAAPTVFFDELGVRKRYFDAVR
jgi:hypothetical protein